MDWQTILGNCRKIKEEFDKSYKCLNTDRPTRDDTVEKHLKNLFILLEEIRVVLNVHYERLTKAHKSAADAFFADVRDKLINVAGRRGIELKLAQTLHETIEIPSNLKCPVKMSQTVVEFLKTASSLIPDFDGKAENLTSFLDALNLVDSIKESHDTVAVSLVKTKLKGTARNLISNEISLSQIINTLKRTVKGESVEVVTARLMNLKQKNKTANLYTKEVADLTKTLEAAYISDGLTNDMATKYSTQQAIKAMTKNCSIDKVKVIMEAGTFNTMNDAISKFVNSCTEAAGNDNAVLYYKQKGKGHYYGSNRGRNRGRGGQYRNNNHRTQYGNRNYYNRGRGNRHNNNRGVYNGQGDNHRNVNMTHSENDLTPLSSQE